MWSIIAPNSMLISCDWLRPPNGNFDISTTQFLSLCCYFLFYKIIFKKSCAFFRDVSPHKVQEILLNGASVTCLKSLHTCHVGVTCSRELGVRSTVCSGTSNPMNFRPFIQSLFLRGKYTHTYEHDTIRSCLHKTTLMFIYFKYKSVTAERTLLFLSVIKLKGTLQKIFLCVE